MDRLALDGSGLAKCYIFFVFLTEMLKGQCSNAHMLPAPEAQKAHTSLSSLPWVKVWQVLSLCVYTRKLKKKVQYNFGLGSW